MIAVALSPQARALIRAHRDARRPTAEDRERVAAALRARLGATVLPLETLTNQRLAINGMQQWLATACGLCVVGGALFLARRPEAALESTTRSSNESVELGPSATARPIPIRASESTAATMTAQGKVAPVASQRARPKVTLAAPAPDTLGQELQLLTSAASQLSSGQATGALLVLEEHQRRFSHGVLSDERNLAKARALCMLHRFDEGRAALALLATGTPAAARVREECDLAWARANTAKFSGKNERD